MSTEQIEHLRTLHQAPAAEQDPHVGPGLPIYQRPNIFICGPSGSGKSTSLRHLDPERTVIVNTEQKPLPFRAARKFTKSINVSSLGQFQAAFERALAADADVIIIDSWTSLTEFVYASVVRNIEKAGDNIMSAWSGYRDTLHDILLRGKGNTKFVVFIGIDDVIQDDKGRLIRTVAVQGGLKGRVEKEFTHVFWTKVIEGDALEGTGPRHVFVTNSDGSNKAKTPLENFDELYIDNDLASVLRQIDAYYLSDT